MKRKKQNPVRWDQPGLTWDMPGLHGDQEFIEIQTDMIQVVFNLHPLTDTLCQFRVRAIGPNNLEGPWSDPAEHMAP